MSVMQGYSLAVVYLMKTFGEGCKICYGDRAIGPEYLGILYGMLFTGIQLETLRLHRCQLTSGKFNPSEMPL